MLLPKKVDSDVIKNVLIGMNWDIAETVKFLGKCNVKNTPNMNVSKSGNKLHFNKPMENGKMHHRAFKKKDCQNILDKSKLAYKRIKMINSPLARIEECIKAKFCIVILLRGCPGSGRTTLAKNILQKAGVIDQIGHLISADNYFFDNTNKYNFNKNELPAAHSWNKRVMLHLLKERRSPIFVDNIHLEVWEMKEMTELAVSNNYLVETLEPDTPWKYNVNELSLRSQHRISISSMKRLLDRFQRNISGEELLNRLNLAYGKSVPTAAAPFTPCSKNVIQLLKNRKCVNNKPKKMDQPSKLPRANLNKYEDVLRIYKGLQQQKSTEQRIFMYAKSGISVMIFMRGCPGSGKTTLARGFLAALGANPSGHLFSADDYFTNPNNNFYQYSQSHISQAHAWNRSLVSKAVSEGRSPIFIDNTHLEAWEMFDNAKVGVANGYIIETLEPDTPWKTSSSVLVLKNQHGVDENTISRCMSKFEPNISGEELLRRLDAKYTYCKPPVIAKVAMNAPLSNDMSTLLNQRLQNMFAIDNVEDMLNIDGLPLLVPPVQPTVKSSSDPANLDVLSLNLEDTKKNWSNLEDLIGLDLSSAWSKMNASSSGVEEDSSSSNEERFSDVHSFIPSLSLSSLNSEMSSLNIRQPPTDRRPSPEPGKAQVNDLIDLDSPLNKNELDHLVLMFPSVAKEDIEIVFENFGSNFDKTVKALLDSGVEMSEEYLKGMTPRITGTEEKVTTNPHKKKRQKKKKSQMSEEKKQLAKSIESKFHSEIPVSKYKDVKKVPIKTDLNSISDEESPIEEKVEFIPLNLDKQFVLQLHERFATLINPTMINEKTMVEVPIELAKQLHAYTVESVYRDIEYEELTLEILKKETDLQKPDENLMEESSEKPLSFLEIMDSEIAQRLANNEKKKDGAQEATVASKLSINLLAERFPTVDKFALPMMLADMNNSLHEVTALFINAGHMPQFSQQPSSSKDEVQSLDFIDYCSPEEALIEAENHRLIAEKFYQQRRECISKAQDSTGHSNLAKMQYYLQMVDWYKRLMEKANSKAAKAMLKGYEGATTLDLHTLSVSEATLLLDLFLDEHIRLLKKKNSRKEVLYIITGRGAHSVGGKPKIKNVAQQRLAARSVLFEEQNPGMLKVIINRNSHFVNSSRTDSNS